MLQIPNDTIVAPATSIGEGAISIVRLSGPKAVEISNILFQGKDLFKIESNRATFGVIIGSDEKIIDEVVITKFLNPKSYTGEDLVEISCHASSYIVKSILKRAIDLGGRMADPGEFTMRAFFNGKMDLSQAEAVADLIASESKASHGIALSQMRGKFSNKIEMLRQQLIDFASLLELELDFSEEDVEFADRNQFKLFLEEILSVVNRLIDSFRLGNVIKKGVPTVIAGRPNAGKSTLLNVLLQEDRAIVSEIAGTTRDTIEEVMNIEGVLFRFIDTAGIRHTEDEIEKSGVERTLDHISKAALVLYLFDISEMEVEAVRQEIENIPNTEAKIILIANKMDKLEDPKKVEFFQKSFADFPMIAISAKMENRVEDLRKLLYQELTGHFDFDNRIIISNTRHLESLERVRSSLMEVDQGLSSGIPSDLVAMDLRQALHYLGTITGAIGTEDLLGNIFGKFCIGK